MKVWEDTPEDYPPEFVRAENAPTEKPGLGSDVLIAIGCWVAMIVLGIYQLWG